jgi:glutamate-1-semialdehyde 2,1-aminomutase
MDPKVFTLLQLRGNEIAAVVINPLQSFHLNKPPPSDLVLASNTRDAGEAQGYGTWLKKLREVCHKAGVMFVLDEVYTGFRLAPGGAQEYFGVKADIVAYGKTLGGGMPIGVVCGPKLLMSRTDELSPLRVNYVVGTFSAHPLAMASMNKFLKWSTSAAGRKEHTALTDRTTAWVDRCNRVLEEKDLPLRVASYTSIWTMLYQIPGRYHWLLQYYLRDEGIALSWVGTGRLNFSMDFTEKDLDEVTVKMVRACERMRDDGWWYQPEKDNTFQIKLRLVKEIVTAIVSNIPKRLEANSNMLFQYLAETEVADGKAGKKSK